jgi:hypothetical protein
MPAMTAQLLRPYGIPPQHAMPTMFVTLQGWGADVQVAFFGQALSALVAVTLVVWAWRRPQIDRLWRNALTCALPLLVTPYGYVYDAIPIMLSISLVAQSGFRDGFTKLERPVLTLLWLWPSVTIPWCFYFGFYPIGSLLLFLFALSLLQRIARSSPTRTMARGDFARKRG